MLGYAFCGSFCTHARALGEMKKLTEQGYEILPIMSETVWCTDTRFGTAEDLRHRVEEICGREIVHTVVDAEPLGPKIALDALVICPCTGNTLAKITNAPVDFSLPEVTLWNAEKPYLYTLLIETEDEVVAQKVGCGRLTRARGPCK